jgi:hypothetical protein
MKFVPLPSKFQELRVWGTTVDDRFTFVVSKDEEEREWRASVKAVGAKRFDNTRHDLGEFDSKEAAEAACETFYAQWKSDRKDDRQC